MAWPATSKDRTEQIVLHQGEPAEAFEWFKVNTAVGNVRNKGSRLIQLVDLYCNNKGRTSLPTRDKTKKDALVFLTIVNTPTLPTQTINKNKISLKNI
jgi:hypothetical protein